MSKVICPACQSEDANKIISALLPMKFCNKCHTLWGEPFATIYTVVFAPIEGIMNGQFMFVPYEGSYFRGIMEWFKATE